MDSAGQKCLLLVEDEMLIALNSAKVIKSFGYEVLVANNGKKAVELALSNEKISLILMDIDLGKGIDGPQAARLVLEKRNIPIVFLTSHSEKEYVDRVKEITRYGYVIKHSGDFVLRSSIEMAFELFEANKKLHDSEESLSITFQSIGDAVIATDINGHITRMNSKAEILTGWKMSEAFGKPLEQVFKVFNSTTHQELENPVIKVLEKQDNVSLANNTVLLSRDGKEYQIADSAAPIRDNNGMIRGVIIVFSDYTEKYKVLEALRESEEKYRTSFNTSPDAAIISTLDGRWIDVNESFIKITGFTKKEVIGKKSSELPIWDNIEERKNWANKLLEKGYCIDFQAVMRAKDGSPIIVLLSSRIIMMNQIQHIFSIAKDVTDLKKSEQALEESEERYSAAFKTSPDAINITTLQGVWVDINESFTRITGYSREEVIGKNSSEINIWANPDDRYVLIKELKERGVYENFEVNLQCKNGSLITVLMSARIIMINQEPHILSITRDITERKCVEQALHESEERYRAAFLTSPDSVTISTMEGLWVDLNDSFSILSGYSREEVIGKTSLEINMWVNPQDRENWTKELLEIGVCEKFETLMRRKDGILNNISLSAKIILINNQPHILTIAKNITELVKSNQALKESEEKYHAIFDTSPDAIILSTVEGLWIDINESFINITGYTRKDVVGKLSSELNIWPSMEQRNIWVKILQEFGVCLNFEVVMRCKDDSHITVLLSSKIIMINNEPLIVSIAKDITQRKQVEQALRESEEWHRAILKTAMDGFWLFDLQGRLLEVNDTYSLMSGYSIQELLTMNIADIDAQNTFQDVIDRIQQVITAGQNRFETCHRRKDGTLFNVEVSIQYRPLEGGRMVAFLRNIDDRKQTEKQIEQTLQDKQFLLHEVHFKVKNFFKFISSLLDVQFSSVKNSEDALTVLTKAMKRVNSVAKIHDIIYEYKDYAHIDANDFSQKLTDFIKQTNCTNKNINLNMDIAQIYFNIDNAVQFGLLINELITNCYEHAFPEKKTGEINISLQLADKGFLELVVHDNGIGINGDIINNSGLGLQLIKRFAEQLDGNVEIKNIMGTQCRILFPFKQEKSN